MKKQHHGNYGKCATEKQRAAQIRNFDIFRMRGILASLRNIDLNDTFSTHASSQIRSAIDHVRTALITETGNA